VKPYKYLNLNDKSGKKRHAKIAIQHNDDRATLVSTGKNKSQSPDRQYPEFEGDRLAQANDAN
jgi:hypothetical protein